MKEWAEMIKKAHEDGKGLPIVLTRSVSDLVDGDREFSKAVSEAFSRFLSGDWGTLCAEDVPVNEEDIKAGQGRAMGVYPVPYVEDFGSKLWIIADITGGEFYAITGLFPSEY